MSTTWTDLGGTAVKAACTTGSESAPSGTSAGLSMTQQGGVYGLVVVVESNDGATALAAGNLLAYMYNPYSAVWDRCDGSMDLVVNGAGVTQAFPAVATLPVGRLAYIPSGLGAATAVNVYMIGVGRAP